MTVTSSRTAVDLYLDLLEEELMGLRRELVEVAPQSRWKRLIAWLIRRTGVIPAKREDRTMLEEGSLWPAEAETMIGRARMRNIRDCVETVIEDGVPGDLIEAGVWRGGACIYMRGILAAHEEDRGVWVADSFGGLPEATHPADQADWRTRGLHAADQLAVSRQEVQANFEGYGLLDESVHFVEGFFNETLPRLDREWAVIRLDGDMYESTMDSLQALYPSLMPGGFLIVDDYGGLEPCKRAVDDYRREHGITEAIQQTGSTAVFWRRSS